MFTIKVSTGNAAFDNPSQELAQLLRQVADKVAEERTSGLLFDTNGNQVGQWSLR